MVRIPTLVAAAFAVCITSAAYAAPAELAGDPGQPLTLTSAKRMVSEKLAASGQRALQPGHAEIDGDGNVHVDLVNQVGLTVGHVIVHANDGQVTDAAAPKKRG